ncbi:MAG: dihydrofolate reductase family protein [Pseudomonadota bacterium]|nr:dihydrofolate reductase family protein [Pseudomonadota bacterium]
MRKLVVGAMTSLDGVMQAPGGPHEDPTGGFKYGGWAFPYFDETAGQAVYESFAQPFDLLLGRKTYDIFAAYWPYVSADDAIGPLFDSVTKYVATRNPGFEAGWQNSEVLGPDAVTAIRKLKSEDGPDLLTQGSTDFLATLFASDLVDEIRLTVFPVIFGNGKKMFRVDAAPMAMKLVSSITTPPGVTISHYARAGDIETGSFPDDNPSEAELERRRKLD